MNNDDIDLFGYSQKEEMITPEDLRGFVMEMLSDEEMIPLYLSFGDKTEKLEKYPKMAADIDLILEDLKIVEIIKDLVNNFYSTIPYEKEREYYRERYPTTSRGQFIFIKHFVLNLIKLASEK